jgi:hypothetical protein
VMDRGVEEEVGGDEGRVVVGLRGGEGRDRGDMSG